MRAPLVGCFAIAFLGTNIFGQEANPRFNALKQALGLGDFQIQQLQQNLELLLRANVYEVPPVPNGPPGSFFGGRANTPDGQTRNSLAVRSGPRADAQRQLLNNAQIVKLNAIAKVFDDGMTAGLAIRLGFVSEQQWGGPMCIYPITSYDRRDSDVEEFALSPQQIQQVQKLENDGKPLPAMLKDTMDLTPKGAVPENPTSEEQAAIEKFMGAYSALVRERGQVLDILGAQQKETLLQFEGDLLRANQAVELGLIPRPLRGDPLCN